MIRAITIDFWNTLFDTSNGEARKRHRNDALATALHSIGFQWNEDLVKRAYQKSYETFEQHWFGSQRTQSASQSLHVMWNELGVIMPEERHRLVAHAFEESILIGMPQPMPGAADAIRALASSYRLALISDTAFSPGWALRKVLEHHGLNAFFTAFVFSDETGVSKPHPEAFQTALAKLGVHAEKAVHIGDIERTDVAGAKALGMKAIRYEGDAGRHPYNDDNHPSRADARVMSWQEIPALIAQWNERA